MIACTDDDGSLCWDDVWWEDDAGGGGDDGCDPDATCVTVSDTSDPAGQAPVGYDSQGNPIFSTDSQSACPSGQVLLGGVGSGYCGPLPTFGPVFSSIWNFIPGRYPAANQPPGTVVIPTPSGQTQRIFGEDGRAMRDIDWGHNHGTGDPHQHPWDWTQDPPRQPSQPVDPIDPPKPSDGPYSPFPKPSVPPRPVPVPIAPDPIIVIVSPCLLNPRLPCVGRRSPMM